MMTMLMRLVLNFQVVFFSLARLQVVYLVGTLNISFAAAFFSLSSVNQSNSRTKCSFAC